MKEILKYHQFYILALKFEYYIQRNQTVMSKRICFSSVLRQKRGSQHVINKPPNLNSLQQIMEEFLMHPNRDYTLRYFQSNNLRACNSKQGFEDGFNQLDHWIHNQIQNSNKQNISDTQPRRQIPNQLLKFANAGSKSPRKLTQTKPQQTGFQQQQQPHRNIDMKQICRQYVENKRNGRDIEKEAPVWRFGQKNEDYYEEQNQVYSKPRISKQSGTIIRQSSNNNKYKEQRRLNEREQENYHQEIQKPKQEKLNKVNTQRETRSQQSSNLIQEIKNNLAHQIEIISQRIIQDKKIDQEEDQQLLISQRQSQEQRDQIRVDNVRKQIGEYLNIKKGGPSTEYIEQQSLSEPPLPKKQGSKNFNQGSMISEKNQQKNSVSGTNNVGYSFSSDFVVNGNTVNQTSIQREQNKSLGHQSIQKNKKQIEPRNSKISLPNIDEVKSQRDNFEKMDDDFAESRAVNRAPQQENQSIDKNYIKEIQSVAYGDPNNYQTMQRQQVKVEREPIIELPQITQNKSKSLFQQVHRQATSIENWQDNNSVVISVAEKSNENKSNGGSNQGSANHKQEEKTIAPSPKVKTFMAPANQVKIQFKKIPSPNRQQKVEKQSFVMREQNSITENRNQPNPTSVNNIATYFKNSGIVHYHPSSISINGTPVQKASISNLLQQQPAQIQTIIVPAKASIPNKPLISVGSSIVHNVQPVTQTGQTSQTVQAINVQSSLSSNMHIQNSKQRNNSLKNSNHDEGRKLKITISPKYNGTEPDKHEFTAPTVGDFRIGVPKMEQSSQTHKYATPSSYQPPHPNQTSTKVSFTQTLSSQTNQVHPPSQTLAKQSISSNKFRTDTLVSNVNNVVVAQHREIIERQKQNAMVRVEKYQKIQTKVEPPKINKASISMKNNQSIKSSQQFEFDLDF